MPAQWVSVATYAETYSVDVRTVRKWIAQGLVETFRVERLMRVYLAPPSDRRPSAVTHKPLSTGISGHQGASQDISSATH